jgi:hypothetical protein
MLNKTNVRVCLDKSLKFLVSFKYIERETKEMARESGFQLKQIDNVTVFPPYTLQVKLYDGRMFSRAI